MAEEEESTPKRRGRGRPRGARGARRSAAAIDWDQAAIIVGAARVRQWQQELREGAQAQIEAGQALLQSMGSAPSASRATPQTRRKQTRRKIEDPVILENRRLALSKAREALAERRSQEAGNGAAQDVTPESGVVNA